MTAPQRSLTSTTGTTGNGAATPEVVQYRREASYNPSARQPLTQPSATEVRPTGPFGWRRNAQGAAHGRRLRELHYIGREVQCWELVALDVEIDDIDRARA